MYVIGTAGHVDHGKSTLVRALTGIDPDRLREEKEREMTIDLGFAWITLLDNVQVGVVDVPGHRDFIENMLAGVGGIDAALFVVAADEGVMPQTREHLAILNLLDIPGGVIALTKCDMVDDPEWLDLVELDVREIMQGTVLEDAPIVRVSARLGHGLDDLTGALASFLQSCPPRVDQGHPRLPIDRVFTISGFGTVVTGTLSGGRLSIGDSVEVVPGGMSGRVRGLQAYNTKLETAHPGNRVAVNITGIEKQDLARGQVLTAPNWMRATRLVDVRFQLLPDASRPLKHNTEVKFFSGAAEALARVRVLAVDQLEPGQEGWLQIRLETSVALARGDRFILRSPSPGETIGGGVILDAAPGRRWRRKRPEVIERLEMLAGGTPAELVAQALDRSGSPRRLKELQQQSELPAEAIEPALGEAVEQGLVHDLGNGWYVHARTLAALVAQTAQELDGYHRSEPLRRGMPREELRSRLKLERGVFDRVLAEVGQSIRLEGDFVARADFDIRLTPRQQEQVDSLLAAFRRAPFQPPSVKEAIAEVGEDLLRYMVEQETLVIVAPDVVLTASVYAEMFQAVVEILDGQGSISAAELRDRFGTTRKYAIAFLEQLDGQGITRREGDVRVWNRRPKT